MKEGRSNEIRLKLFIKRLVEKRRFFLIVQVFGISSKPFFQENSILCFYLLNTRMLHTVRKKFGSHKYSWKTSSNFKTIRGRWGPFLQVSKTTLAVQLVNKWLLLVIADIFKFITCSFGCLVSIKEIFMLQKCERYIRCKF